MILFQVLDLDPTTFKYQMYFGDDQDNKTQPTIHCYLPLLLLPPCSSSKFFAKGFGRRDVWCKSPPFSLARRNFARAAALSSSAVETCFMDFVILLLLLHSNFVTQKQSGDFLYTCAHFSEIRGLCSTKCSSETLQNLLYLMYKKTHAVFFSFFCFV